jgi:hypothetical protein
MEAVADEFEATKWRLSGVTEESQNSSGHPILVAGFKPGTSRIRSGSGACLYRSFRLKRDLECGYGHDQLKVRSRSAPGTIAISSRYVHDQLQVRSRSAPGAFTLSSRYVHDQLKVRSRSAQSTVMISDFGTVSTLNARAAIECSPVYFKRVQKRDEQRG